MADIPVYRRQQLPAVPARVKPSYWQSARMTQEHEMMELGETIAGFAGRIFNDLIKTRANNEIHEFLSQVETAQENFRGFIRSNPGASFEDMGKERDRIMAEIRQAGEKLSLPLSKRYATDWYAQNEDLIKEKMQSNIEDIVSEHEFDRFRLNRERLINTKNKTELQKLYKGMAESGLLDEEYSRLSFELDSAKIDELAAKDNYIVLRQNVWNRALEIGKEQGYKKAAKFIAEQKELEPTHRQQMINSFEFFYDMGEIETQNIRAKQETELLNKLDSGQLQPQDLMPENTPRLTEEERNNWTQRLRDSVTIQPKTNWKTFNKHENNILDAQWGRIKRENVLKELVKARYDDHTITDNEYKILKTRLEKQYPSWLMGAIDKAFAEQITRPAEPSITGLFALSKTDPQRQAAYHKALFDWIDSNYSEDKGYVITPEDVLTKAVVLSSFFKYAKDYTVEPDRIRIVDIQTDRIYTIPKEQKEEALKEMVIINGVETNKYRIIE